jgi:stage IV sporulation protein FB
MFMALLLCLLGLLLNDPREHPWLPLVLLSMYLFFVARQELRRTDDDEDDDDLFGYDFSQGYTSLEEASHPRRRSVPGPLRRWLRQRRDMKQRRLRDLEAEEERRVDEVLIRVKELGVNSLSPDERALLERVSARYRNRTES